MENSSGDHLRQLFKNIIAILTRPEKIRLYFLIVSDAIISILDIASLLLLIFIINFYTRPLNEQHLNFWPQALVQKDSLLLIAIFLIAFIIKNALAYQLHHSQIKFVYNVATRLSETKLLRYLEGKYRDYVSIDSSVYIRQISQQPVEFSQHVLAGLQQVFTQSFLIIITVTAILVFNAKLFLMLLLLLAPPVILVAMLIKKKTTAARKNVKLNGEKTLQHIKEALSAYIESNIYGKRTFFTNRYINHQKELNRHLSDLQVVQSIPGRLMEVFAVFGFFILLLISKWNRIGGQAGILDILTIGMFMASAYKIMPGLVKILNGLGQIRTYDYTIRGLMCQPHIQEFKSVSLRHVTLRSAAFRNISFQYKGHEGMHNISFELKSGDFIGINGLSGKGKTTMVNILLGFLQPETGAVFMNGQEMETTALKQFWPAIAYVKQEPFLINDSILKNIILADGPYDEKKMDDLLKSTGLSSLIGRYPEGINKCITENGKDISGGQRQRIAIARALYKNADLVILDEPFNELDRPSEDHLLDLFSQLAKQGKMILLITHNKESLAHCHKIISLDEH